MLNEEHLHVYIGLQVLHITKISWENGMNTFMGVLSEFKWMNEPLQVF